ncbi:SDR family oxidoreductase [Polycladidibacter hongkongensis]|uniref:SDR family oxidoreductase n=1 Tax=Polycladidibacter hongkongensis TaxID=1647556 RepID=UPI0008346F34|nr:SDR family oxidoreductase [Pseudovibrio hongkongensis]
MTDNSAQRAILITGCSTGIGYDAAHTLQKRGWCVVAAARKAEDVERLKNEGLNAVQLDYQSEESITKALAQTLELTGGRLDALFNNGAYGLPGAIEDIPTEALRRQFEANFFGWHELTRQAIAIMRPQGHGRIVQCSSVLGLVAMDFRGAYNATKFALEGYTDTLRLELHTSGIQVSLIEPGPIATEFSKNAIAAFYAEIGEKGRDASAFKENYRRRLALLGKGGATRFKLPPSAVTDKLIHAIEAPRARARYRVTFPTKLMAVLRRVLSTNALDAFLRRAANSEER